MLIGILAIQGDFQAHARRLEDLGLRRDTVAPVPAGAYRFMRKPADLEGVDGIVLPGGESTAMLRLLEPEGFFQSLKQAVAERPVLATCAGAILLARSVTNPAQSTLGVLSVTAVRNAYGRQRDSSVGVAEVAAGFTAELGADELETVLIRAPRFEDLGPDVRVVASAGGRPLLLLQGEIVAASFHPELSRDTRLHGWFLKRVARRRRKD